MISPLACSSARLIALALPPLAIVSSLTRGSLPKCSVTSALVACGAVLAVTSGLAYRFQGPTWPLLLIGAAAFATERITAGRLAAVAESG